VLTAAVVIIGVQKGIEKASIIMMPILVVLILGISIFCITRPGALEGVKYYLLPDFKHFSLTTVIAAMGQMFYSMSLAMGIMMALKLTPKWDLTSELMGQFHFNRQYMPENYARFVNAIKMNFSVGTRYNF
jgi:NSS family neurotransmitter:Na+ symporter